MQRRKFIAAAGAAAGAGALGTLNLAWAQNSNFPSRPIRLIVGYAPGGGSDFVARTLAKPLGQRLGQPIIVENRPGAATIVAAGAAKAAPADGYTIFAADVGTMIYNPLMYKKLPYDPLADFTYIGLTVLYQFCLVCHPDFPAKNVNEVIEQAKRAKDKLNYASPGVGSTHHLTMEMFAQRAGIQLTHSPYKGSAPALQDTVAGVVPLMMVDMATGLPMIKAKKLRPIAMASHTRSPHLPDVPTFEEVGMKGIDTNCWSSLVAPKNTPAPVIQRISQDLQASIALPETQKQLIEFGVTPFFGTPADVQAMIKTDAARWKPIVEQLNIALDS
jgi:tripartite-type tricarboxylate transporter receptor subunit TctC